MEACLARIASSTYGIWLCLDDGCRNDEAVDDQRWRENHDGRRGRNGFVDEVLWG